MHRSVTHRLLSTRARVGLAASIAVVAATTTFAVTGASASTPPSEPSPSEPAEGETTFTIPEPSGDLDLDRRAITEAILLFGRLDDIPFDRDCVADIAEQLPAADVPLVLADLAASAVDVEMPDITIPDFTMPDIELPELTMPEIELPELTMPDLDLPGDLTLPDIELPTLTMPDIELPEITLPDIELPELSLPDLTIPETSDEANALREQLIYCVAGDADPALVEQALAAIVASPEGAGIDTECAAAVLTSFPDDLLQAIIDANGEPLMIDDLSDEDARKSFLLFACTESEDADR